MANSPPNIAVTMNLSPVTMVQLRYTSVLGHSLRHIHEIARATLSNYQKSYVFSV